MRYQSQCVCTEWNKGSPYVDRTVAHPMVSESSESIAELWNAVENGTVEDVKRALERGADVNQRRILHGRDRIDLPYLMLMPQTPLMMAAKRDSPEIINLLLEYGADIDAVDVTGYTALQHAAARGNYYALTALLDKRANPRGGPSLFTFTPLMMASTFGHTDIIDALLQDERVLKDINYQDEQGRTALMLAILSDKMVAVDRLLQAGAEINVLDNFGHSALWHAVGSEHVDALPIVDRLIAYGADLNFRNNGVETVLFRALNFGRPEVAERLIDMGVDVNIPGENGFTPLMLAVRNNRIDLVKRILKAGADKQIRNNRDETALSIARQNGYNDIVDLLLDEPTLTRIQYCCC